MKQITSLDHSNQLIVITGARGGGKTNLAATFNPPSTVGEVYWHDSENSANNVLANLKMNGLSFGNYVSLRDRFGDSLPKDEDLLARINMGQLPWVDIRTRNALVDYWDFVIKDLDKNLTNKYSVYVHDTIELLEASMAAWVETNKSKSGVTSTAYGKLWSEGVFPLYGNFLAGIHARGVRTIIFTSHLKTPWEGNRPVVGKVIPSGKKILYFLSRLMLWLVRDSDNASGAPAGLVIKERLGNIGIDKKNDTWNIRRMLPRRIPTCTWDRIREYLVTGCDLINPAPGESLSVEEESLLAEFAVSDKALELMILDAKKELETMRSQNEEQFLLSQVGKIEEPLVLSTADTSEIIEMVKKIMVEVPGISAPEVRTKLTKELNMEVPLPNIIRAMAHEKR